MNDGAVRDKRVNHGGVTALARVLQRREVKKVLGIHGFG